MNDLSDVEIRDAAKELADGKPIATAVTYQVNLDRNRQFVFQTYIARDATVQEHRALVDKLTGSLLRLELEETIRGVEADLSTDELTLAGAFENYSAIGAKNEMAWKRRGKQGDPKLSEAEEIQKGNFAITIKGYKLKIEEKKKGLEILKARLAEL